MATSPHILSPYRPGFLFCGDPAQVSPSHAPAVNDKYEIFHMWCKIHQYAHFCQTYFYKFCVQRNAFIIFDFLGAKSHQFVTNYAACKISADLTTFSGSTWPAHLWVQRQKICSQQILRWEDDGSLDNVRRISSTDWKRPRRNGDRALNPCDWTYSHFLLKIFNEFQFVVIYLASCC